MISRISTQFVLSSIFTWCILVSDYFTHFLRNRSVCSHCNLQMILAEVLRPNVIYLDGFLVEFLVLLGTIHECSDQLNGVHDDQSIDYEGHHCARVSCESGLALKF